LFAAREERKKRQREKHVELGNVATAGADAGKGKAEADVVVVAPALRAVAVAVVVVAVAVAVAEVRRTPSRTFALLLVPAPPLPAQVEALQELEGHVQVREEVALHLEPQVLAHELLQEIQLMR
jgi:hypothetical protein